MLEKAIATLSKPQSKPHFLLKANGFFGGISGINGNFIQIIAALGEEFSIDALPRKFSSDKQQ
jgi:hypothetical protein